jgi:hypothetical protein
MRRNPLYAFNDVNSVGVYNVPLNSTIHILDDGTGVPRFVEIISKEGLNAASTIGQFLADPTLYIDLSNENEIPSELEKLEVNSKVGWRILGRDPNNFGEIGNQAIDLSTSNDPGSNNGATGENSFAVGTNVQATASVSTAMGVGTQTNYFAETSLGQYNVDPQSIINGPTILTVGVGQSDIDRKNGLEVYTNGVLRAPECSINEIAASDEKTIVTKEYADDIDGGDLV